MLEDKKEIKIKIMTKSESVCSFSVGHLRCEKRDTNHRAWSAYGKCKEIIGVHNKKNIRLTGNTIIDLNTRKELFTCIHTKTIHEKMNFCHSLEVNRIQFTLWIL